MNCEAIRDDAVCGWSLADEELRAPDQAPLSAVEPPTTIIASACVNGHPLEPDDVICLVCGGDPQSQSAPFEANDSDSEAKVKLEIDGWIAAERQPSRSSGAPWEHFIVSKGDTHQIALLTLYHAGFEPDPAVHDTLRRMPRDHIPELLATGRHQGRAYEIVELIDGGTLAEAGWFAADDPALLRRLIDELGRALADFAEAGLRHRDLRPDTILLRTREPLDLVITGFGSARLSDFDLEAVAPLELTRYSAPEAIVGAVSAASDWWSLGMLILEQATAGGCFTGVNDQAFRLHVVTRGMTIPASLEPSLRTLLRSLLTRDPLKRWGGREVQAWLAGDPIDVPEVPSATVQTGPTLRLKGQDFFRPDLFALAAAEAANWAEGRELTLHGSVGTWLAARKDDARMNSEVRRLTGDEGLSEDLRHALALMAMNPSLPLTFEGDIVTPAWLLANPEQGYAILASEATRHLERMGRETWLVRLKSRSLAVRERALLLDIELDEDRLRLAELATSRANLEAERGKLRRLFPDTEHPGLSALMERARLSDEDLIIVISAAFHQFVPLIALQETAQKTAASANITLDTEALAILLVLPRREIFSQVETRIANFARCENERIDGWADAFRVERRMPLDRAAALLATAQSVWKEPPRQQYVASVLDLFEKRVSAVIGRGPLTRFVLGKTTPRLDLSELGTALRPAEALLNHVLSRIDLATDLDPAAYGGDPTRESRLRRLISHADTFRRDTGIDSRYLGFPFLMSRDGRAGNSAKPRLAPVLLWPVAFELASGASRTATLMFDRNREEVRLNPALEGILGSQAFERWCVARDELLARSAIRIGDVMDVFGAMASPRGRTLVALPNKDAQIAAGVLELIPAATLFNAEFTGQTLAEDLRQMSKRPPGGTALDSMLRVSTIPPAAEAPVASVAEQHRFTIVESDPSQDVAVIRARSAPGLLIEGPPGTGKSQIIVNIVADSIGRGETVLVVCQKQPALHVVAKRLRAEQLGDRFFLIGDINKDRPVVINALREQLPGVRNASASRIAELRQTRAEKAARIEVLEKEIDRHHEALHVPDDQTGFCYRDLVAELIGTEAEGAVVDVVSLRPILGDLDRNDLARLEETCAPLAHLWFESDYEDSPLHVLKSFAVDPAIEKSLQTAISAFVSTELIRRDVNGREQPAFQIVDPEPHESWLNEYANLFADMQDSERLNLSKWLDHFRPLSGAQPIGDAAISDLRKAQRQLEALDPKAHSEILFEPLAILDTSKLLVRLASVKAAQTPVRSLWARMRISRWRNRRKVKAYLIELGLEPNETHTLSLQAALNLELELRSIRVVIERVQQALGLSIMHRCPCLPEAKYIVAYLLDAILPVAVAARAAFSSPQLREVERVIRKGTLAATEQFFTDYEVAFQFYDARQASLAALANLYPWFNVEWITEITARLNHDKPTDDLLADVIHRLSTLASYQRFRARVADLDARARRIFALFRPESSPFAGMGAEMHEGVFRRTLHREALRAWKGRIEARRPEIGYEREEIERKVKVLAGLDQEMRVLNRQLLQHDIDNVGLGSQAAWEAITRLTGPRALRLREILDQGAELGLMRLRPVWLMTPDIASRTLPLKSALFDVVIYDEASQMPVEHALPTLFRGRRTIISGDEKQMPPSSFFSSRLSGDDDEEGDSESTENATDAERIIQEDNWNRREVQNCPDLLQLGRSVLPSEMLQIHYRSKYRELISFSNVSFYKNKLNVPARHPDDEIRRVKPIEVIRVEGIYQDQTNLDEAKQVVETLAEFWRLAPEMRPSIGVVTFNRKQADLVLDEVELRAAMDPEFLAALQRERERTQNGEDMGFFVKNVENVQGDERDVIVFSTTFGRNRDGTFKRFFGVLGQAGGERRLNVAVTRARIKIVLVTSMPIKDVSDWLAAGRAPNKPRDYLQAYLDYASKLSAGELAAVSQSQTRLSGGQWHNHSASASSDGFITSVKAFINEIGHRPIASVQDGDAFGLDFAIEDPRTGLFGIGIECDAPRHPLLARARAREIWRPAVLRQSVPRVHRVSSSAWYSDMHEERQRLRSAIEMALGQGNLA